MRGKLESILVEQNRNLHFSFRDQYPRTLPINIIMEATTAYFYLYFIWFV